MRSFAVLLSLFVFACHAERQPATEAPEPVTVVLDRADATPMTETREVVGTVRSRTVSVLSSRIPAHVIAVRVVAGDPVERGETLVELDDHDARAALRKAEAGLRVTRATWKRYATLLERGSVSRQEFDEVEARYRAAEADEAAARTALGWTRIRSPIDGVVTAKPGELGMLATPGRPLLTIEDDSVYRLEASLEETWLASVHPGAEIDVRIDALRADVRGRVAEVMPAADPASRTFVVKLDLPELAGLRSGMFGRARFVTGETTVVTAPIGALFERGQLEAVWAVDESERARLRFVRTGRRHGERVEILSGLDPGELVVAGDTGHVVDGGRVLSATAARGPEP